MYFKEGKDMKQDFQTLANSTTDDIQIDIPELKRKINDLDQIVKFLKDEQELLRNQLAYCLANLAHLGIPIEEQSVQDYQYWLFSENHE